MYMQKDFGTSLVLSYAWGIIHDRWGTLKIMTAITSILVILGAILIALVFTEYGHQIFISSEF